MKKRYQATLKLLLLLMLPSLYTFGQTKPPNRNSVFLELGGVGGHFSFNYDRTLFFSERFGLLFGLGFSPSLIDFEFSPRLPIQLQLFYQRRRHVIQAGMAYTPYIKAARRGYLEFALLAQVGYNYALAGGPYYVGIAFTPVLRDQGLANFFPWGTIRFGYRFQRR